MQEGREDDILPSYMWIRAVVIMHLFVYNKVWVWWQGTSHQFISLLHESIKNKWKCDTSEIGSSTCGSSFALKRLEG